MEAAEESHNSVQSLLNFIITLRFQTFLELVISVKCNKVRSLVAFIHKILKCHISSFLKLHVILKCILDDLVHLLFETKQLCSELQWVFEIVFIFDNLSTFIHDKWRHFIDDIFQSCFNT